MNNGKYSKKNTMRRLRWSKQFVLLASVIVLLVGAIGGSLAYLFTNTDPVVNTFTPGEVKIEINEPNWDGKVKNNVTLTNTGNVPAYIRAMIVVTWQNEDGEIYHQAPATSDYTVTWNPKGGWTGSGNGWYTTTAKIPAGGVTPVLLTNCKPAVEAPEEGYFLVVDVIAEAIQADGGASF